MDTIGRYTIIGELGRGAMGVVYRAQDPAIGRTVAIKTIRLSDLADAGERTRLRNRLFREAQSAGVLSHPNIITIYDIAEQDDFAYIAMEYVDGPTLDHLVASDVLDGTVVLRLLKQMAGALDYAHTRGIVHRDIKPANIIVQNRETAKIADFGVAKMVSAQMTHAGALVGTPGYMSPQQIQGQEVDGKSDQFSLAVIAYELLTGEKPFAGESLATLIFQIVKEKPEAAHRLNATLGWPVDTVLQRGLAKAAEDRFPSCEEFIAALESACRASKSWHPIAAGAVGGLDTISEKPAPVYREDAPTAPLHVPSVPKPAPVVEAESLPPEDPKLLRGARWAAVAVLGVGLIGAVIMGAFRYFGDRSSADVAEAERAPVESRKPTPIESSEPSSPVRSPASAPTSKPAPKLQTPPAAAGVAEALSTQIVSNPPGASVIADGNPSLSCQTPCALELTSGRHTLAASLDGYRRMARVVQAPGEEQITLALERISGTLMVRSEPKGAAIRLNGQERPERTPAMFTLPVGAYTVEVGNGRQRQAQEVVIKDSTITNITLDFLEQ